MTVPDHDAALATDEQLTVIGEFDLTDVGRCRAYQVGAADTVSLSRDYPDRGHGKDIARARWLVSSSPEWRWPQNWSEEQCADAEGKVRLLWKHHTDQRTDRA